MTILNRGKYLQKLFDHYLFRDDPDFKKTKRFTQSMYMINKSFMIVKYRITKVLRKKDLLFQPHDDSNDRFKKLTGGSV